MSYMMQCESMAAVEKKLAEMGIKCIHRRVEDGGIFVDQLFFHDPDGFMIEICNCDNLPVIPLGVGEAVALCKRGANLVQQQQQQQPPPPPPVKVQQCHEAAIHVSEDSHNISCA